MAFLDHNGESEFPLSKGIVFEAMCKAIPNIKGLKIEYADKLQGRIMVKAGVSMFSWGENIPIQLIYINENLTKVQITSSPKTGIMFGGAFDMGKNRKNIEAILSETSKILSMQNSFPETNQIPANQSTNFQNPFNTDYSEFQNKRQKPWYKKTWLIILSVVILLIIIANIGGADNKTQATGSNTSESNTKTWTSIITLKGNGEKKSQTFELTSKNARVQYKYVGESGLGTGAFALFVVKDGDDIMKDGGIPDISIGKEEDEGESYLHKTPGKYYIDLKAVGNWTVTIEEEK